MPRGGPTRKQLAFRDRYLDHGDAERAYREAGYTGAIQGMYRMLKAPWFARDDRATAIALVESAPVKRLTALKVAPLIEDAVAKIAAEPVHPLETRRGLQLWLIQMMEGKITQTKPYTYISQDGDAITEYQEIPADHKERVNAAKLLAQMQGWLVQKVDVKGEVNGNVNVTGGIGVHVVHVDNGRGPARKSAGTVSGTVAVEVCEACGGAYDVGSTHVCAKST